MDRAKADADRARLLDDLLDVLADPAIPDDQAGRITYACNLGYAGMADASGISEDQLAWTAQWYLRQDTLRAANTRLVNAHHALDSSRRTPRNLAASHTSTRPIGGRWLCWSISRRRR